ncbi:uncharacterized protein BO88DRAFT_416494 [Aspergillus vadensis CBS 113365]|uniref:F-box domain-containing protein n=1 Tax=Aspergillus vadensis (strain CBS 113365 / IMI 142717 / IBT 24658) TaxID=1448311 RepID=A0A319BAK3_ASPVC|nr:hypothetical protein BO88DRAFT_416494 [Aspergillus vadensis CBS 113365]PYH67530.1 hypothetical protein BO88DRAFT_416494 [Aspergillus vadensis CBS 113365]
MLDRLPPEVLLIALEPADLSQYITRHDLNNICRVSKHLYAIAVPLLYKSVILTSDRPGISETWHHVDSLLRAPVFPVGLLVHMRDIEIQENRSWHGDGCLHNYTWRFMPINNELVHDNQDYYKEARIKRDEIRYLSSKLLHVFSRCPADRLQRFSWNIRTCLPSEILGDSGYLILNQRKLVAIHLRTGSFCAAGGSDILLSKFACLRSISWLDLCYEHHVRELCLALKSNAFHLTQMNLGVTDTSGDEVTQSIKSMLAKEILDMHNWRTAFRFPVLQDLSFYYMDLTPISHVLSSIFNVTSLLSLSLRLCKSWEYALFNFLNSGSRIALKTLTLETHLRRAEEDSFLAIPAFLKSFEGLEELYISVPFFESPVPLWRSVLTHKKTLRKLVCQQLHIDGCLYEEHGLYLGATGFLEQLKGADRNPSIGPNLVFLGKSSKDFNTLKSILTSPGLKANIRVLHLRRCEGFYDQSCSMTPDCGDDISNKNLPSFRRFLTWAFGSKGPPELQAVGHYAFVSMQPRDVFYFRDAQYEDGYRCVIRRRSKRFDLFRQYRYALDACRHDDSLWIDGPLD